MMQFMTLLWLIARRHVFCANSVSGKVRDTLAYTDVGNSSLPSGFVFALVEVERGLPQIDICTRRTADVTIQLSVLSDTQGAYTVVVKRFACFIDPVRAIPNDSRLREAPVLRGGMENSNATKLGAHLLDPDIVGTLCRGRCCHEHAIFTIRDVIELWGYAQPPFIAVTMLAGFGDAVCDQRFKHIVLKRSWRTLSHLFPGWPGPEKPLPAFADCEDEFSDPRSFALKADNAANLIRELMPCNSSDELKAVCGPVIGFLETIASTLHVPTLGVILTRKRLRNYAYDDAVRLIRCVLFADGLKAQHKVKTHLREAIYLAVPFMYQAPLLARLEEPGLIPSPAQVLRLRQSLDVAFAVWFRDELAEESLHNQRLYLWLDSSPIANETWLNSKLLRVISCDDNAMLALIRAQHFLGNMPDTVDAACFEWIHMYLRGQTSDEDRRHEVLLEEIQTATTLLATSIDLHYLMPSGLGSKSKGLVHVLAGFHHILRHECKSMAHLERVCDVVYGVCSDGGTELGIAEAHETSKRSWFCDEFLHADRDLADDEWVDDAPGAGIAQPVFKQAVGSMGSCHICDNCTKNMLAKGFTHNGKWKKCLGALCDLMAHAWLRKLFVSALLEEQGGAQYAFLFLRLAYPTIKEWRWGTIIAVMRWVVDIEVPFRRFWNRAKWLQAAGKKDAQQENQGGDFSRIELDLDLLDEAVKAWFWAYTEMMFGLQRILEAFQGWSEDCSCHQRIVFGRISEGPSECADPRTKLQRQKMYGRLLLRSVMHNDCPMRGLRAPDFAAGDAMEVFDLLADMTSTQMVLRSKEVLSGVELSEVLLDFHSGLAYMKLELYEKLKYWFALPWLVAGLVHRNVDKAAVVAAKIINQISSFACQLDLPRQMMIWLRPEYMSELEALATKSRPREELRLLLIEASKLMFLPTSERPAEEPHAMISKAVSGRRKRHTVTVSLANRLPEIERRLTGDASFLGKLANALATLRTNPMLMARVLNLQHHRTLATLFDDLGRDRTHLTAVFKPLAYVIYHTHASLQFVVHTENRFLQRTKARRREAQIRALRRDYKRAGDPAATPSDTVLVHLMHEHFRTVVRADSSSPTIFCMDVPSAVIGNDIVVSLHHAPTLSSGQVATAVLPKDPVTLPAPLMDTDGDTDWVEDDTAAPATPPQMLVPFVQDEAGRLETVFFMVVDALPGARHTMPVELAGGHFRGHEDVVLSMHQGQRTSAESAVVSARPSSLGDCLCDMLVSSNFGGNPDDLVRSTKVWTLNATKCAFAGEAGSECIRAVTELVRHRAFPGTDYALDCPRTIAGAVTLERLRQKGFVAAVRETEGVQSWQITKLGVERLTSVYDLGEPASLYVVRDQPLVDMSRWELSKLLIDRGWKPYVGNSRVDPVRLDDCPSVFVISKATLQVYLLALCYTDELLALGHSQLVHRQKATHYMGLLRELGVRVLPATASQAMLDDDPEAEWLELADAPAIAIEDQHAEEVEEEEEEQVIPRPPPIAGDAAYPLRWGAYAFTRTRTGWQVECPFHKKKTNHRSAGRQWR
jgi:hypothetical protein